MVHRVSVTYITRDVAYRAALHMHRPNPRSRYALCYACPALVPRYLLHASLTSWIVVIVFLIRSSKVNK